MAAARVSFGAARSKGPPLRGSGLSQKPKPSAVVHTVSLGGGVAGARSFAPAPRSIGSSARHRAFRLPNSYSKTDSQEGYHSRREQPSICTKASTHSAWETLGLKANSSTAQIKKAYRKLVMLYHPDVAQEDNTDAKFQEIHEAYLILQGKLDGSSGHGDEKWDFHDWYWSFAARHRKRGATDGAEAAFTRRTEGQKSVHRAKVSQQLQQLKKRARSRGTKASGSLEAVPPPEVHPAWAAVSCVSEDSQHTRSAEPPSVEHSGRHAPAHERYSHEEPAVREPLRHREQGEAYHYSHRPPPIGSGHLASQLSGLRRKAKLRDQVAV